MIRGGVIAAPTPLYDGRSSFSAHMHAHAYLDCYACGGPLLWGLTEDGAPVFACPVGCGVVDMRRVG